MPAAVTNRFGQILRQIVCRHFHVAAPDRELVAAGTLVKDNAHINAVYLKNHIPHQPENIRITRLGFHNRQSLILIVAETDHGKRSCLQFIQCEICMGKLADQALIHV